MTTASHPARRRLFAIDHPADAVMMACVIALCAGEIGILVWPFPDQPYDQNALFHNWIARLVRDIGLNTFLFLVVVTGMQLIRAKGWHLAGALRALLGLGIFFAYVGGGVYLQPEIGRLARFPTARLLLYTPPAPDLARLRERLADPSLTPERREVIGRFYASESYQYFGRREKYELATGERVTFQPTDEDRKAREATLLFPPLSAWIGRTVMLMTIVSAVVCAASVLCGLFLPLPVNERSESTAGAHVARRTTA